MSDRLTILATAVREGRAWGTVLLPTGHGDTCGATLDEAEEVLSAEVGRLRAENEALKALDRDVRMPAINDLRAENERISREADQYRTGWLEKTAEVEQLREAVALWERRFDAWRSWRTFEMDERGVRTALAELVRLKDGPRDDAYRAVKDAAWDAARTALQSDEVTS